MNDEKFQTKYKTLTKHQKEAVDTIEGPVMVIAGPGTGKTTILTLRIANILRLTDTPPSGILAITFTDSGVKAIKKKLREIIGSRADEVRIHTFHSFSASLISEYRDHFFHLDKAEQLTEIENEELIKKILEKKEFSTLRPLGKPEFYIRSIIHNISESKRGALTPEMVASFANEKNKEIKKDENSISTRGESKGGLKAEAKKLIEKCEKTILFSKVYEEYEKLKREKNKIDYDDLIFELLKALKNDELFLQLIQEKFLYVLVDEHQDTNDAQNEIIFSIANFFDNPNVFIVGDEKQAIYRFQGASVSNFLKFKNIWKDIKVIALEDNFRSHQHILDASFEMIEKNYSENEHQDLRVKLKGHRDIFKPIDIISAPDIFSAEEYLSKEIKEILKTEPEATIAIITRKNKDLENIIRALNDRDIKVTSEREINIFSHPVGLIFFSLIGFLNDLSQTEFLSKTIASGLWHLDFESEIEALKALRTSNLALVEKMIPALKIIKKNITNDNPINFLTELARLSGFEEIIARDPSFVEVWRGIISLSEQILEQGKFSSSKELIENLLAYKSSAEEKSVKVSTGAPETRVLAMTAHGSKGLEFDYVFIPFATEEAWISRKHSEYFVLPEATKEEVRLSSPAGSEHGGQGEDIKDIRRLFYVALTRAKKHVTLLVPEKNRDEKLFTPIRFISELNNDSVKEQSIPQTQNDLLATGFASRRWQAGEKILDYAKNILVEKGLSVTALNHFLKCPCEFIWKSILKVPEGPNASSEKGNAMHKAFDQIWKSSKKDEKTIEKIIKETVSEYISTSLLPKFEKESIIEELHTNAPNIAHSLYPHLNTEGEVHAEEWSENIFDGKFLNKEIQIPIHGRLDVMIIKDKEVLVFDYKTKGKMSENEIKGNTKSSNGDYFRQLVFYKLLLRGDNSTCPPCSEPAGDGRREYKNKNIIPSLVFLTPDEKGRCAIETFEILDSDIEKVKENIQSLIDSVWSGKILENKCEDETCEYCKLREIWK
ncbi:MAG: ATP-dependent DNA helicase [Candidatus Paceibacterota bacterium]